MALKPLASTRTVYDPGVRLGALYIPSSFVTNDFVTPLSVSVTVTAALEMTPPLWSVIVPQSLPKTPCEDSGRLSRSTPIVPSSSCRAFGKRTLQDVLRAERKELISGPPVQNS